MVNAKPIDTPIVTFSRLYVDEIEKPEEAKKYRRIIDSLLYLTNIRQNIFYNIGLCARFLSSPKESHMKEKKMILRYL